MYNNRRNNRFNIFIGAIIVSLLVLLTGCTSTKRKIDLTKQVAEDSSNPVTLTVYLTAHYANPDTHCPIYEKLLDYQKENPNITIQFVSPKEGDTAEREAEIHQLNTEILSGKGPDLFIMEGNRLTNVNLFPDIEKSMMNGAFLDLTDVMDSNEFTAENFYMTLLDAGKLKGKQYILPLCFSVPTLTSAESVLKNSGFDTQAALKSLAATMDELLRIYKEKPMLVVTDFSMTSALSQPIIDYKNHIINLDTASCRQTLAYEKEFRTGEISYEMQNGLFDSFNPEIVRDCFANSEPCNGVQREHINEGAARRAKEMNSFSDYKEGSATAEYRAMVDKAAAIAEQQKSRVDPMYHEKIDHLLDTYARKLAENMNQGFAIDARVPSVMIAGPANFPVGKKEKQNRARDSNMEEWRYIQGLLDKIRSTGMGGISADDPAAIEKLQKKLDGLERSQLIMKEVNAYYRKHGKLDGCALLSPDQIQKMKASMAANWRSDPRPFESYQLTNNNAEIRRVKTRIEQLSKQAQREFSGWEFDGGRVEMNREDNRLQVFFDGKPDADTRAELKSSGFRWAPSVGAWQRQLTDNAIRAADRLECIKPLSGEKPSQLQKKPSILQTMREQGEKVQTEPEKKAPSGRDAER